MICVFVFDWNSFWINIIAGIIFFVISILFSIWLIPKFTIRLLKKRNKIYLIKKLSAVIQELCEFLIDTPFKDEILNFEKVAIFTRKKDKENYCFVGLSSINVFNKIVFPKMTLVIYDYFKDKEPNKAFELITDEYNRLKNFRTEIEKILAFHSLHLDDDVIFKISDLCFEIRRQELDHKADLVFEELLKKTESERTGIFGLKEIPTIYKKVLELIKQLASLEYFEYTIENSVK